MPLGALHDEIELARRLDYLVELDDVSAAPDELQDMDLTRHALHIRQLLNAFLLQDLNAKHIQKGPYRLIGSILYMIYYNLYRPSLPRVLP